MLNPCWAGGFGSRFTSQFWSFCYQDLFHSHSAPREDLGACHLPVCIGFLSKTTWGCGQGGICGMLWYLPRQSILRTRGVGAPILHPCHSQSLCMESSTDITVQSRSWQHLQGCQKSGFYRAIGNLCKKGTRSQQPVIVQDPLSPFFSMVI